MWRPVHWLLSWLVVETGMRLMPLVLAATFGQDPGFVPRQP